MANFVPITPIITANSGASCQNMTVEATGI